MELVVEEEDVELFMVCTISYMQAIMVLSWTVIFKGIDMAVIQEPWYRKCCIGGLNISVYILFSASGLDRHTACTLTRKENSWMLPGLFCRDLATVMINCKEDGAEKLLLSLPHIFPAILRIIPHQRILGNLAIL